MRASLVIQNGEVVFAPSEATWTLEGKATETTVTASRTRSSFDHKIYATTLTATLSDTEVIGTYVTPTCSYAVKMTAFGQF